MEQLTIRQLEEWKAYDKLDPIGQEREDLRFATLWARILNLTMAVLTPKGKQYDPVSPGDFMPEWYDGGSPEQAEPKEQTVDQMKKIFYALAGKGLPE